MWGVIEHPALLVVVAVASLPILIPLARLI
jgi:hypothetical protein